MTGHSFAGEAIIRPTTRFVCRAEGKTLRVYDLSDMAFCPFCGDRLERFEPEVRE
jgi:rRNA maturation endonuclease Nob1